MQQQEPSKPITVAVVEDNPRIRELLREEILDEGHQILDFSSAEEFLEAFSNREERFDLVLLDLMLPGMDGLCCLRSMRQTSMMPRVVIVTALNDSEKRRQALADGAEDYVLKPDLFQRLPEILGSAAAD